MSKGASNAIRVYLDEFNLSGFLNDSGQDVTQETPEVTTFSDAGPRRVVGNYDVKASDAGFFDGVAGDLDDILQALWNADSGDDHYLLKAWQGITEGATTIVYEHVVALASEPIKGASGGAVMQSFESAGRGGSYRGQVLRNATISGTGSGSGQNLGATTTPQRFAATIRVVSGTFTSITVNIQESSDDAIGDPYATISGMSATLTAAGVSRVSTTATTEAWKRVNVSAFTGTSCVLLVTVGRVAGE